MTDQELDALSDLDNAALLKQLEAEAIRDAIESALLMFPPGDIRADTYIKAYTDVLVGVKLKAYNVERLD